jgi:hypothetical protein
MARLGTGWHAEGARLDGTGEKLMPGNWTSAAYACLMVALYVAEPSQVDLTVRDRVRIDRVTAGGAEQHGELLQPGTTSVRFAAGTYYFRSTRDVDVQLADGAAVQVTTETRNDKDPWPLPKPTVDQLPDAKGDTPPDRVPTLTVR